MKCRSRNRSVNQFLISALLTDANERSDNIFLDARYHSICYRFRATVHRNRHVIRQIGNVVTIETFIWRRFCKGASLTLPAVWLVQSALKNSASSLGLRCRLFRPLNVGRCVKHAMWGSWDFPKRYNFGKVNKLTSHLLGWRSSIWLHRTSISKLSGGRRHRFADKKYKFWPEGRRYLFFKGAPHLISHVLNSRNTFGWVSRIISCCTCSPRIKLVIKNLFGY